MISATSAALTVWKPLRSQKLHARTLAAERFLDFPEGDRDNDARRRSSEQTADGQTLKEKPRSWRSLCLSLPDARETLVFAQLKAALVVNAAGGVLENGGMCLDRVSGLPFIPGSAVKGCARRAAIAALREWSVAGAKPVDPPLLAAAAEPFESPAAMLETVAWVFGWCRQDWEAAASDFQFACGSPGHWEDCRERAVAGLWVKMGNPAARLPDDPWREIPSFAGAVAFLPAFPWDQDPGVELDIVTPHHTKYYTSDDEHKQATDTEEPVPSVFPVVSAANEPVFTFPLVRRSHGRGEGLAGAALWLRAGLGVFGLGGKTSAGYGWFDTSPEIGSECWRKIEAERENAERDRQAAAKREHKRLEEQRRQEDRRRLEAMPPEARADAEIAGWDDNRLKNHFLRFNNLSPDQQGAIYRILRGPKAALWHELRESAIKGNPTQRRRWAPFMEAILKLARAKGEKMP